MDKVDGFIDAKNTFQALMASRNIEMEQVDRKSNVLWWAKAPGIS